MFFSSFRSYFNLFICPPSGKGLFCSRAARAFFVRLLTEGMLNERRGLRWEMISIFISGWTIPRIASEEIAHGFTYCFYPKVSWIKRVKHLLTESLRTQGWRISLLRAIEPDQHYVIFYNYLSFLEALKGSILKSRIVNNKITIPVPHTSGSLVIFRSASIISTNTPTASKILAFLFNYFSPIYFLLN